MRKNGLEDDRVELIGIPLEEWRQHREDVAKNVANIRLLTGTMSRIENHTQYIPRATEILGEIRNELVSAATGKDHVPVKVFLLTIIVLSACFLFAMAVVSQTDVNSPWVSTNKRHQADPQSLVK